MSANLNLRNKNSVNVFINILDNIKKEMKQSKEYRNIKLLFIKQFNYDIISLMDNWLEKTNEEFIFAIERDMFKNKIVYTYSNSFVEIGFGFNGKTITISFLPRKKSNGDWDMRFTRTMKIFLNQLEEYNYNLKTDKDDYHLKDILSIEKFIKEVKNVNSSE